jgi:peptide chain release factor 2
MAEEAEEELDEAEDIEESADEELDEGMGGDAADDLIDDVEMEEESDMNMEAEGDEDMIEEARKGLVDAKTRADRAELEALLSGEADGNDAYLEINAGAGGTESQDWASILRRTIDMLSCMTRISR